ncbi:MAG TPA: hypothetical protein VGO80_20935 [Solirubrobacteraceae bacterium]|jgi:hypothetical protein|nr:hypothetical protein [Solirubrobacteraceae bacterium]
MPSLRSDHGQATLDYVALIAVLAVLIGAAAAVAGGGAASMTNVVLGQMRRALCIVTGGACPVQRELPCIVAGDRETYHVALSLAIVRIDSDRVVARERLSDGTIRLTVSRRRGAGIEGGVGGRARLTFKGRTTGSERGARGAAEGVLGWGEVFVARDDRQADEILRALRRPRVPIVGGPRPREVVVEGGVRALGSIGLGAGEIGASLDGIGEGIAGVRRDMRTGDVTISLGASGSSWALVSALAVAPSGSADRQAGLALTLDRRGRPTELSLTASGALAAGAALLPSLTGPRGVAMAQAGDMGGRRWELGARVDLRDPGVAAAWAAFRRDPTNPAAVRALAAQLRERAHLDVRSYAMRSDFDGVAAGIALGLRAGGELDRTRERSRLLTAATRPPGGLWEQRIDCVDA